MERSLRRRGCGIRDLKIQQRGRQRERQKKQQVL